MANDFNSVWLGRLKYLYELATGQATLPGGLAFPATQVPSTDPNTLDDYEEVSWVPTITFGGAAVGLTYTTQIARADKIGRRVCFNGYVRINDNGSSSGSARIGGLPYTSNSDAGLNSAVAVAYFGVSGLTGGPQAYIEPNSSLIQLWDSTNGAGAALTEANLVNSSEIIFSGTFNV